MTDPASNILIVLQQATEGLYWISESDHPFGVFQWQYASEALTPEKLLELSEHPPGTPIEAIDFDTFFEWPTQEQDWHSPEEKTTVKQYQQLVATLKQQLSNLQVYKVGAVNLDIYVVGKTQDDHLAGLITKVVET